jgi:hypothetical protein
MDSVSSVHDFVLNLLSDPTALTQFATDPQALLASAGLSDIAPADITNALPLVIDYAPSHLVGALETAQSLLPVDVADGPAGAVAQLTALTSAVNDTSSFVHIDDDHGSPTISGGIANPDLGLQADGSVGGSLQAGLAGALGVTSELGHANFEGGLGSVTSGLSNVIAGGDLTGALDGDAINKITAGELNTSALSGATAFATNVLADPSDLLAHPTDITNALTGSIGGASLPGDLTSLPTDLAANPTGAVSDTLHSVLANVPDPSALGNLAGLHGVGDVTSTVTNLTGLAGSDPLSTVTSHLPAGVGDLVNGVVSNVGSATSQIPGVGDALHGVTGGAEASGSASGDAHYSATASSASPLDGVSASAVGDTVSHVTSTVTDTLHNVLPDSGDHGGLLGL